MLGQLNLLKNQFQSWKWRYNIFHEYDDVDNVKWTYMLTCLQFYDNEQQLHFDAVPKLPVVVEQWQHFPSSGAQVLTVNSGDEWLLRQPLAWMSNVPPTICSHAACMRLVIHHTLCYYSVHLLTPESNMNSCITSERWSHRCIQEITIFTRI